MRTPESKRLSAWLLVAAAGLLAAFFALVAAGERGGDTFFSSPWLSLTVLGVVACVIAAGVAGIVSFRRGDRSLVGRVIGSVIPSGVALAMIYDGGRGRHRRVRGVVGGGRDRLPALIRRLARPGRLRWPRALRGRRSGRIGARVRRRSCDVLIRGLSSVCVR